MKQNTRHPYIHLVNSMIWLGLKYSHRELILVSLSCVSHVSLWKSSQSIIFLKGSFLIFCYWKMQNIFFSSMTGKCQRICPDSQSSHCSFFNCFYTMKSEHLHLTQAGWTQLGWRMSALNFSACEGFFPPASQAQRGKGQTFSAADEVILADGLQLITIKTGSPMWPVLPI